MMGLIAVHDHAIKTAFGADTPDAKHNPLSRSEAMSDKTLFHIPPVVKSKQCGKLNPFWKGGRVIASNGYVLIRVGVRHHLADVRGYAYEHRIEAEKKIGRRLRRGEIVHHKNENKQDNCHENLDVKVSAAEHFLEHRKPDSNLRLPGGSNPLVLCQCGCHSIFRKYDSDGRPRRFISGHNEQPCPAMSAIRECLKSGQLHRSEISQRSGMPIRRVAVILSKMKRQGIVDNKGGGAWQLHQ